jgi:hypothetical protein
LLSNITPVEATLLSAYENEEEKIWREGLGDSPHGHKWSSSFHGSEFPGDDDSVCGRALVYGLTDPAPESPLAPKIRAIFDVGTQHEHNWVKRLSNYGVLLSANVTGEDEYQTNFSDSEVWLSGSPDVIMLPPFWNKSHIVEVKTTSHEKVLAMQQDPNQTPYSHRKYVRQTKLYIGEAHDNNFSPTVVICETSGILIKNGKDRCSIPHSGNCIPKLLKVLPPEDGTLVYSSREDPFCVVSYYIMYDKDFIDSGKKKLKELRGFFERDEIPPHVREGESAKWSVGQCQYCSEKRRCKVDYKEKRKHLSESEVVNFTKSIRPWYSYQDARAVVFDRWGVKDPLL